MLVEEHRDRIAGAVVYELASLHTVNLATTLAGLRGGVVASAEQAELADEFFDLFARTA